MQADARSQSADRGGSFDDDAPADAARPPGEDPRAGKDSRWAAMLDHVARHGRLDVAQAAGMLKVSEATIRRDFAELSSGELVARRHGGIVAKSIAYELPARYRSSLQDGDKQRIARAAALMVEPGEVVGFNGGTTTTATARELAARDDLASDGRGQLTVVTNALNIATELVLRPHIQCVSLGGVARPISYEAIGPLTELALGQLWLNVAILGVDGISAEEGASSRYESEASISSLMSRRAARVVVVAAGQKVGVRSFASVCPASRIQTLVTDSSAPEAAVAALRAAGVDVVLV